MVRPGVPKARRRSKAFCNASAVFAKIASSELAYKSDTGGCYEPQQWPRRRHRARSRVACAARGGGPTSVRVSFFAACLAADTPKQYRRRIRVGSRVPNLHDRYGGKEVLPTRPWALAPAALHRVALDIARDFHPVLRRFVEEAHVDYTILTSLAAATRPAGWRASRVTLLGDAVHAMPPTGALGGNTALRDAALLAQRLQEAPNGDLLEAVRRYQEEMMSYAFKEVDSSVAMLRRTCAMHPLARFAMLRTVPWLRSLAGQSLVPAPVAQTVRPQQKEGARQIEEAN